MEKLFKATHRIGINNFHIWDKQVKGGVWMLYYIWGKKDFRLYLGRRSDYQHEQPPGPVLVADDGTELVVTRLQYLNNFEWYDYQGVVGHGLSYEETRWRLGKRVRYVELPKDFFDTAVELGCREFGLQEKKEAREAG